MSTPNQHPNDNNSNGLRDLSGDQLHAVLMHGLGIEQRPHHPGMGIAHTLVSDVLKEASNNLVSQDLTDQARGMRVIQIALASSSKQEVPGFGSMAVSPEETKSGIYQILAGVSGEAADSVRAGFNIPPSAEHQAADKKEEKPKSPFTPEEEDIAALMLGYGLTAAEDVATRHKLVMPERVWGDEMLGEFVDTLLSRGVLKGSKDEVLARAQSAREKIYKELEANIRANTKAEAKLRRETSATGTK